MIGKLKEIDRCFEAAIKNYECLNHEASRNCCVEGKILIAELSQQLQGALVSDGDWEEREHKIRKILGPA